MRNCPHHRLWPRASGLRSSEKICSYPNDFCSTGKEVSQIFHIERRGSTSVIHTSRVLDLVTRDSFTRILSTATRGNGDDVVIDLENCAYVDSTAINVLVAMSNRGGRRLSVVIPPGNKCRRIFDICGLGDVLNITTSIDEALSKVPS